MSDSIFELTVLGARGSMASASPDQTLFGGDSSCYMLRVGEETVFLDAGSGMLRAPAHFSRAPVVLLSHLHLDHLIGLGMFPGLSQRGQGLEVYVPSCRTREEAEACLGRIYAPPFWPITLQESECGAELMPMPESLVRGELRVDSIPGSHPDGCRIFRVGYRGRSLVYATDYEHEERSFERLAAFAQGTDLLLYDAQYTAEEYPARRGFGHSTAEKGLELMARCGAKRLLLIHHSPWSTDRDLLRRERFLPQGAAYAREGQRISII